MGLNCVANFEGKDNLSSTIKNIQDELKKTGQTASGIDKIQEKFEKIQKSSAPLKRQLRDLQAIMAKMNMDGLTNTSQFTEIAQYAGQLRDAIGDAQQAVSRYASDTSNLDAMASAFQGISGAISLATGAMNLFGVENEDVKEAILKVQSAMALLNGVQAIANTLNKDSALMLKLKSIWYGTNTVATTANTTAEAANTVATTANTTAEVANTAAEATNTAATKAATTAQLANNAAVLANPYVIAAAAVVALTAGIVAWISASDDATDSEIALTAAVDAFTDAADGEMNKCAESINLFNELQKTYQDSTTDLKEFSKKLIENTEVQKKLGVVVKTVDDVHRLFANKTGAYQRAAMARASAMAAEAAQAAILGSTLSELTKVYAKLQAGEEVNWRDMRKIVESAGFSESQANKMMREAGFVQVNDFGFNDIKQGEGDIQKLFNSITSSGAIKELERMGEQFKKTFKEIDEVDFNGMLTDNFNALDNYSYKTGKEVEKQVKNSTKATKTHKTESKKAAKEVHEEVKKVLTTLEGCDAIVQEAQKKINGLDKNSADYTKNLESLKNVIYTARVSKLQLLDRNTLSGLAETKNIIQQIINDLPQGSEELNKWQHALNEVEQKSYAFALNMSNNGSLSDLKKEQSTLAQIIETLPEGSKELEKWVKIWRDVTDKIDAAATEIENLKLGIENGSIKTLQDQITNLQEKLTNKNLDIKARIEISDKIDDIQRQIDEKTNGKATISVTPEPTYIKAGSTEDLRQSYSNAGAIINQINDDFQNGIIKTREEAVASIDAVNEQLLKLGLKPIQIHFETDWDKQMELINGSFEGVDSIISAADSIEALGKAVKEGKSDWEIFKTAISATESVLSSINTVIQTAQLLQEAFNTTKAVSASISASDAAATGAAMAAQESKSVTDGESATTAAAATVALKEQEAAYLDMAAAAIYAAHASIPFVGVGLSSGFVTTMMAAMAAQHAASKALVAFKDGGIVGGSMYHGDRIIARLNSGEMVLDKHQQATLFKAIDSGAIGMRTTESQQITFKLKGSDIYGSLKNFTGVKSKSSNIKSF